MVCTVTLVSAGRTAPEPMERVVCLVPAGRTPRRLCGCRGCYDARDSEGTCPSLRSVCGAKRPGTLHAPSKDNFRPAFRGSRRSPRRKAPILRFFPPCQVFPASLPVWLQTTGAKPLPGSAFLAIGLSDSVLGLSLWDPKATGL